ncbi:L-glyceraldehyde 3-phosphate reductase [Sediminihabitans luteus]|uniref:L-glyceraldehyde 3-phosphate reductase n=1 Tax=Sediminihabitans luteus TaxID=1138585 RepID=A0A2M9CPS2_9CELL|nr:aldo/keto reductase [Sediminihabitans luteus]PJJ73884.1 L-glyceraldehyde 3-phosphate reductase [Sediminihabitans luteus]GII98204.1 glyceraldehyde 3-phosphate reductase [Sediminihabitans luteus]
MSNDLDPAAIPLRRAGRSGLDLPAISLGLWQNFGATTARDAQRSVLLHAVERGVVQLDMANNYGPPPFAAESFVGDLLRRELRGRRDELVLTTKAGYHAWSGPYGEGGSRKYLLASLDRSLASLGVDTVDVFYSHRYDPTTPLTETIGALATAVTSGRAHYVGISSYSATRTREALAVARDLGVPLTVHQPSYSLLNRWVEQPDASGESVLEVADDAGLGVVAFSPLAQGMLTDKYLDGVPQDSRAATGTSLRPEYLSEANLARVRALHEVARARGTTLARLAIAWVLREPRVTTVLVGARTVDQLDDSLAALDEAPLGADELAAVEAALASVPGEPDVNLWASRSSDL